MTPQTRRASAPSDAAQPVFELDGVGVSIGPRPILDRVSLRLEAGTVVGLVGPNGSGKSTLLRVLANQLAPDRGARWVLGQDPATLGARAFARLVAFMPQFTPPAEGMTVAELVSLGRFAWHGALGRFTATDRAHVEDALQATNLVAMSERLVDTLSGGERQRVWLATMLAQAPRGLLLDEPTSALDIAHQVEVLDLVKRLSAERGLCAVLVLHDVNMAARVCGRILALREGTLVADGTPDEILTPAVLETLYGVPMAVARTEAGVPFAHVA